MSSPLRAATLAFAIVLGAPLCTRGSARPAGTRAEPAPAPLERIYEGGLAPGWHDYGWAPRTLGKGAAQLDLSNWGGWIVARPGLDGDFGGLRFELTAPASLGDFLEVRLDDGSAKMFPHVTLGPQHRLDASDGITEVWISFNELNPHHLPFDRVVFRAARKVQGASVRLDHVALTAGRGEAVERPGIRAASMSIDCGGEARPISPFIYGIAYDEQQDPKPGQWNLGATARRWGGNTTSRYNWEVDAWNTASDWYFRNVRPGHGAGPAYREFLQGSQAHGVASALTVPLIGWVAKDVGSVGYPVSLLGPQQQIDPYFAEAGNGKDRTGQNLPADPTRTSTPSTPEWVGRWVSTIRQADAASGKRSVQLYILDNEPMLWSSTHRDVHPDPVGYDELLERTVAYAHAIRQADPGALIAGPALWGWPAYQYSAIDAQMGFRLHPDRSAHGNEPLLAWYLRKLREHEKKTGERLLDVVDVHFYPQAPGVFDANGGETDPVTNARRLRSTRALWDPGYVDESWIGEPVQLLPRLRGWIDANYPGQRIAIGEYNFGGAKHMSGALAQAEVLGRFGQQGVYAAYYWTYPSEGTPAFWAFRAYRNFDGHGARFLDLSLPTTASAGTSLFASRSEDGKHLVAVVLNLDPKQVAAARVALKGCGAARGRVYVYRGGASGFASPGEARGNGAVELQLPPYSITVLDLSAGGSP